MTENPLSEEEVSRILDSLPPQYRRICTVTGGCACMGCVGMVPDGWKITQKDIDRYNAIDSEGTGPD